MDDAREAIESAYEGAAHAARLAAHEICAALTAPHVVMRPRVTKDGNRWCAVYGDNIMEGVAAFGDSPQDACFAFDAAWRKRGAGHDD